MAYAADARCHQVACTSLSADDMSARRVFSLLSCQPLGESVPITEFCVAAVGALVGAALRASAPVGVAVGAAVVAATVLGAGLHRYRQCFAAEDAATAG